MSIDGQKLRRLREAKGFTQEKLAALCNLTKRTIQRAEAGTPVALETVSFIADALDARPDEFRAAPKKENEPKPEDPDDVVLVRTASGRKVISTILRCFDVSISYDVEPTKENIEALSALSERLKSAYCDPHRPPLELPTLSDVEVLRLQADLNEDLQTLPPMGFHIYMATYMAYRVIPYCDPYEENMMTKQNQPKEEVELGLIVVSDSTDDHLIRQINPDDLIPF